MTPWRNRSLTLGLSLLTATASAQTTAPAAAGAATAAPAPLAAPAATPLAAEADAAALAPAAAPVAPLALNRPRLEKPSRAGAAELTWLGHAAWLLRSPAGTTVLIDPWLSNPRAPQDFVMPETVDAILVTHGHADHLGEAVALSKQLHAPIVASHELVEVLGLEDGIGANPGGTVQFKDLRLHLTQAVHSSSLTLPPPPPPHGACGCHHGPDGHGPDGHDGHGPADVAGKDGLPPPPSAGKADPRRDDHHGKFAHHGHDHKGHKDHAGHGDHKGPHGDKGELTQGLHAAAKGNEAAAAAKADAPLAHGELLPEDAQALAGQPGPHVCDHGGHRPPLPRAVYAGAALGFVIEMDGGPTLYHAGDTDAFGDMALIGKRYRPQVALLPIGGHYTMGPEDAALAARLLGTRDVIPMHYGTIPQLTGTPAALREALGKGGRVIAPAPGARVSFVGANAQP